MRHVGTYEEAVSLPCNIVQIPFFTSFFIVTPESYISKINVIPYKTVVFFPVELTLFFQCQTNIDGEPFARKIRLIQYNHRMQKRGGAMYKRNSHGVLLLLVLLILACATVSASVKKEIHQEFTVASGGELMVNTEIGSVEVLSGSGNRVVIDVILDSRTSRDSRAEEMFEDFEIEFEQDGNNVNVYAEYDGRDRGWFNFGRRNRLQVKYEIRVPETYNIYIETSGGSIGIGDIKGEIDVKTSGGSLHFEDIAGYIKGRTSGGSITIVSCDGDADIRTSGGSIKIGKVLGDVDAHTSGGSIRIDEVMGTIDATTSGGSIKANITKQPDNDCVLKTSGGSVTLYLADDLDVDIDARTSSGRVYSDFDGKSDRYGKRKSSLRTSIGKGGPEVYMRTSGGNIEINKI